MAMRCALKRLQETTRGGSWHVTRSISTSRVLSVSGTKKGKIVEAAKKSGYKKGGKKPDKKKGESKNMKDAGAGTTVRIQVQSKRKLMEPMKISDTERQTMLAELNKLAKETSRILMREHREKQWSEAHMLNAKYAAIAALPPHLREKVRTPFTYPRRRVPPTLLPPVDGYVVEAAAAKKAAGFKKMR